MTVKIESANESASEARKALVFISPGLAVEWLKKSIGNRPLMHRQVDRLAREIVADRWNPEASEIRFDLLDRLIDGHHRLHAIVKAGIGVWQWVAFGCREDTVHVIDTGVARTPSGMRTMLGQTNAKFLSTLANSAGLLLCNEGNTFSLGEQDELLALIGEPLVSRGISWNRAASASRLALPGHLSGVLLVLARTYEEAVPFADRLVAADGEAGDPAREAARWLAKQHGGSGGSIAGGVSLRSDVAFRVANAWAAHSRGEQRLFLRGKSKRKGDSPQGGIALASLLKEAREGWARTFVQKVRPSLLAPKAG